MQVHELSENNHICFLTQQTNNLMTSKTVKRRKIPSTFAFSKETKEWNTVFHVRLI